MTPDFLKGYIHGLEVGALITAEDCAELLKTAKAELEEINRASE